MKHIYTVSVFICFFLISLNGLAQVPDWGFVLEGDSYSYGQFVRNDQNDDIVIAGTLFGHLDMNPAPDSAVIEQPVATNAIFLAKYDRSGTYQWAFPLVTDDSSTSAIEVTGLDVDMNGNIYITGSFTGTVNVNPDTAHTVNITATTPIAFGTFSDIFLICYSSNGEYQWHRIIRGPSAFDMQPGNVTVNQNGMVYIAGRYNGELDFDDANVGSQDSLHAAGSPLDLLHYIARYDNSGNFIEVQEAAGGQQITCTQNGEIISCRDSSISHFDSALNPVWSVAITSPSGGRINKVVTDIQDNTIVSATYPASVTIDGITYTNSTSPNVRILMSINQGGGINWVKNFETRVQADLSLTVSPAAEVFVGGLFLDSLDIAPGMGFPGSVLHAVDRDMFFAVYDYTGAPLNAWSIGSVDSYHMMYDLASDLIGDMIVLGDQTGNLDIDPSSDSYLLINPGHDEHVAMFKYSAGPNWVHDLHVSSELLNVAPNPSASAVRIEWKGKTELKEVTVIDLSGRTVFNTTDCKGPGFTWNGKATDGHEVAAGAYLLRVRSDDSAQTVRIIRTGN